MIKQIYRSPDVSEENPILRSAERKSGLNAAAIELHDLQKQLNENEPDPVVSGKELLFFRENPGTFLKPCPCTPGVLGCGYEVLHWAENCPFDCHYCALQSYFPHKFNVVFTNFHDCLEEVRRYLKSNDKPKRIGTGEFTDSLALEFMLDTVPELVSIFAESRNAVFEIKTKSLNIEPLNGLTHKGRTVTAWSLNPDSVIREIEKKTPGLEARLEAAATSSKWGYALAFHFDPIVHIRNWKEEYGTVLESLFAAVPAQRIAWISLGTFRFPPVFKNFLDARIPGCSLFSPEFELSSDGKYRYPIEIRREIYTFMHRTIRQYSPLPVVYLCMERNAVWKEIFETVPAGKGDLNRLLYESAVRAGK